MLEHEMKFREIKYTLLPDSLKVLRTYASKVKQTNADAVAVCRLYLPALSYADAKLFLQWMAKEPV
jgi:hypothetical protein